MLYVKVAFCVTQAEGTTLLTPFVISFVFLQKIRAVFLLLLLLSICNGCLCHGKAIVYTYRS